MQTEANTEPAEVGPRRGKPMEPVHFSNDSTGCLCTKGSLPRACSGSWRKCSLARSSGLSRGNPCCSVSSGVTRCRPCTASTAVKLPSATTPDKAVWRASAAS
jgi:hypothetical protein